MVNFPDESYIPLNKFENIKELFNQKNKKMEIIKIFNLYVIYSFKKLTKHSFNLY